jgi:hypothetical protein
VKSKVAGEIAMVRRVMLSFILRALKYLSKRPFSGLDEQLETTAINNTTPRKERTFLFILPPYYLYYL